MGFSWPEGDDDEENTPPDLPPAYHPLLKRIRGIYELLQEQSKLLKSINQSTERNERVGKRKISFLKMNCGKPRKKNRYAKCFFF